MKLTHITDTALGTTTTKMVARPLAIVNYLNARIDTICAKSIKTESVPNSRKLLSSIPTIYGDVIVLLGYADDILPVLSWLNEASSAYMSYIHSIEQ